MDPKESIEATWADRARLAEREHQDTVDLVIGALDRGELRVATHDVASNEWTTHAWLKKAILLYFAMRPMEIHEVGPFQFHDKIPLKHGLAALESLARCPAQSAGSPRSRNRTG